MAEMREITLSIGVIVPDTVTDHEVKAAVSAGVAVALVTLLEDDSPKAKAATQYSVEIEGPGTAQ